ncbi:hypothetical protein [Tsuneonella amylolytica]|uniref:hypothetical protein n=1 Tax=Tsuneonella amylolytica TaxID=2338327 RepID=UPI000EA94DDE|nr:hypothetical protein [Tsuneonella amylolytica]
MALSLLIAALAVTNPSGDGEARGVVQVSLQVMAVCRVSVATVPAEGLPTRRPAVACPDRVPRTLTVIEPPPPRPMVIRASLANPYAAPEPRIVAVDF